MASSSTSLNLEGKKVKQRRTSGRSKSPASQHSHGRSRSKSPSSHSHVQSSIGIARRGRRPTDYGHDNHSNNSNSCSQGSKEYDFLCDSPTESLSSSLSSFPPDRSNSISEKSYSRSRRERDHLKDDNKRSSFERKRSITKKKTPSMLPVEDGTMIEIAKITALVEEELQSQRDKHKDQLNRTVAKFKDRRERFINEIDHIREERDELKRELEKCKRSFASQQRAAERNDRLQYQQRSRIESLEEQKEVFEELQAERDALLDEIARSQQHQQKTKDELSALKVRVREDSQKRLSVMECLSTSWDAEQKEAKEKEALLNSELDIMAKTLKAEQDFLKNKNKEFAKLEALYRSTKTEIRSIKMSMMVKKQDMEDEIQREREICKMAADEYKKNLKLKDEEINFAKNTIRSMKADLESAKAKFDSKEESMAKLLEETKKNTLKNNAVDPEVMALRDENGRLKSDIKELQKQVESYLANMALQQEFCDSLKSRIYKEQESEQKKVEEMHKLRKKLKKQLKEAAEKDLQIDQLKHLLGEKTSSPLRVQSKSSRELRGMKKSSMKKPKSFSLRGGYKSS